MELKKTDSYAKAYVEILELINYMGEAHKKKIPSKLLNFFEENKDFNYSFQIDKTNNSEVKIFSDKTIGLLAMLELKYWAKDNEKEVLNKALAENENKYQKKIIEKYNTDNLFKNKISNIIETGENSVAMVEYKESFLTKIKNWFKRTI